MPKQQPPKSQYSNLKERRRQLRQDSTLPEAVLWRHLRNGALEGLKFRRQRQIGPYIVDFYCDEARLVVELDGAQHFEPEAAAYDQRRTFFFESHGLTVLRVTNSEVLGSIDSVLEGIVAAASKERPSP